MLFTHNYQLENKKTLLGGYYNRDGRFCNEREGVFIFYIPRRLQLRLFYERKKLTNDVK